MSDAMRRTNWPRILTVVLGVILVASTLGWVAIGETPAAQQLVEKIKPYDPYDHARTP